MEASFYFNIAIDLCNQNLDEEDIVEELKDCMKLHGDRQVYLKRDKNDPAKFTNEVERIVYFYNPKKLYKKAKHYKF